ncbi:heme peroxidase [Mycena capillaripes]|nr:heme peroxidase [Mycena capillaripes]
MRSFSTPLLSFLVITQLGLAQASPQDYRGTFSLQLKANHSANGAADGSLLVYDSEVQRADNNGLQNIVAALKPLPAQFDVTPGDVLHASSLLYALFSQFLSPSTLDGREPSCRRLPRRSCSQHIRRTHAPKNEAPLDLLPSPFDPVPKMIARFVDMGFSVRELMALIGAHTTGKQSFVDTNQANKSFDSTVDIWDVRLYSETQAATAAPARRLVSDIIPRYPGVSHCLSWAREYADAHEKMSLLGYDKNTLIDCTEGIPQMIDLKNLAVSSSNSGKQTAEPTIDRAKLEAAIQQYRSIWLQ